ncbi:hypothetical protein H0H81_006581 [Sphagnurus paluster]|uniref:Uncharacterized protein n=1 Tax=Sphagnurus paluster TaxID=117069 RepID=A0A9P7FMD0_9AGAR|nr:hypothetical protein H0H81_006581 [Sphagnurus paluster]
MNHPEVEDATTIDHLANHLREAIASANAEMAASAFEPVIAILHHLLQRDLKGEIYINKMIHRNAGKDAAANFAFIIDAISPLLSKMAEHKVQLDHSNPEVAKFLHLASINNNLNAFKDPNNTAILSLQDEVRRLRSTITEKDQLLSSISEQNTNLRTEKIRLGKKPAASGKPTSPAPANPILQQILSSLSHMQKEIAKLKGQKADKTLGASIHAPTPKPPTSSKPTPQAPASRVWVPDHTLQPKGKYRAANFPGGVPHPMVTSTQYPKGHPSCYEPIPATQGPRNGIAVLVRATLRHKDILGHHYK